MTFTRTLTIEDSSQITDIAYSPSKSQMIVAFMNGQTYLYDGVDQFSFGALASADSVGAAFNRMKAGLTQYIKLSDAEVKSLGVWFL